MIYRREIAIEFNHCDPAGIVFYPRYFEMVNSTIENFFADVLGYSYRHIHMEQGGAVPTVHIETDFRAVSKLGDRVTYTLEITRIGGSSVTFRVRGICADETRLESLMTLAWVPKGGRAARWPDDIRNRMTAFMESEN